MLLALEHVDGHNPVRPWRRDELDASLDTLELIAQTLTPPPLQLPPFAEEFAHFLDGWDHVRATYPEWPHLDEAVELASRFATAGAGNSLVHTDARDDNLLVTEGRVYLCDWNWPVLGAAWIDTVCLLMTAHGDGLDADAVLAERRLTRTVDPDSIDSLLALFCGYFLARRDEPVPHSSPYLRVHQDWYAEVDLVLAGEAPGLVVTSPSVLGHLGFGRSAEPLVSLRLACSGASAPSGPRLPGSGHRQISST